MWSPRIVDWAITALIRIHFPLIRIGTASATPATDQFRITTYMRDQLSIGQSCTAPFITDRLSWYHQRIL